MLRGDKILLRAVEPSDATTLILWENDPENWKVTDTEVPFSLQGIMQLIDQQQHIRSTGQLRFMICELYSGNPVGAIDLYDADFRHGNASVGILIGDIKARNKGYASQALQLMMEYAAKILELYNVQCSIQASNLESIHLFERAGFSRVGVRKNWFRMNGKREDEIIYQLCLKAE
ncbi:MAG: GNAT family N-acetyltransferase [Flavobacteriia bacterium]|jgi:diamine N-acetyltransferase|nr:GNAT family N-acetyltransferase [Cryomorphaceae bacterium]